MELALKEIAYTLPRFSSHPDTRVWKLAADGIFTTKSAYQTMIADEVDVVGGD
ncbi:hypothetical protein COLO4_02990, partial [Corchorus olitorius]